MTVIDTATVEGILREEISAGIQSVLRLARIKEKVLLTEKDVEELYSIPVITLREWRKSRSCRSSGPQYWKKVNRVYYTHSAIMEFMRSEGQK